MKTKINILDSIFKIFVYDAFFIIKIKINNTLSSHSRLLYI